MVPYLCLLPEDSGQRVYNLRDVFDGLRWIVRSGSPWRYLPKDFPPWEMVYQQSRRWLLVGRQPGSERARSMPSIAEFGLVVRVQILSRTDRVVGR